MSKDRKNCLCTAMLYDPAEQAVAEEPAADFKTTANLYERLINVKKSRLLKLLKKKDPKILKKSNMLLSHFYNL